jgi:8'-apo-carotenoid 13,14-cleaving dioxygenase
MRPAWARLRPVDPSELGALERWTIDPVAKSVRRKVIDAEPQEFPRPDERRFGQPYRYIYTSASPTAEQGAPAGSKLFKHDMEARKRQVHDFGAGRHPGEFVLVPESADSAEDEGCLMGFVVDSERDTTELVSLDAQAFQGAPIAAVQLPHRVPRGFHGNWLPN